MKLLQFNPEEKGIQGFEKLMNIFEKSVDIKQIEACIRLMRLLIDSKYNFPHFEYRLL